MPSEFEKALAKMKEEMKDPQITQKGNILTAAEALEKQNFPLDTICKRVIDGIKREKIPIKPEYVRKVLPEKYKEVEKIRKDILIARAEDGIQILEEQNSNDSQVYHTSDDEDNYNNDSIESQEERRERLKAQRDKYSQEYDQNKARRGAEKASGERGGSRYTSKKHELEDDTDIDEIKRDKVQLKLEVGRLRAINNQLQGILTQKNETIKQLQEEIAELKTKIEHLTK